MPEPDINLLPQELRKAEEREQKRPVTPPVRAGYSAPVSEFEERLRGLSVPRRSVWQRMKDWFITVPVERVAPLPPPVVMRRPLSSPPPHQPLPAAPAQVRLPGPPPAPPVRPAGPPPTAPSPASPLVSRAASPHLAPKATPPPIPLGVLLDVNLLPSDSRVTAGGQRPSVRLALIAGAGVLLIGIAYAVLSSLVTSQTSKLAAAQTTANSLEAQAEELKGQLAEVQGIGHRMDALQSLLTARPDWAKFFNQLEALTLPTVNYTSAAIAGAQVSLGAEAPSIKELARQLLVFQESTDVVAKVTMGSLAAGEVRSNKPAAVRTTFQLDLVPAWLAATPAASSAQPQ